MTAITPARTARWVAAPGGDALVHQVRAASILWQSGHQRIHEFRVTTLCGESLTFARMRLRLAHDPDMLTGLVCGRCADTLERTPRRPAWKQPSGSTPGNINR